ncbi:MAG: ABC transporter ATP-binding protein, partial [Planctomycetes bacterium]|nr:ABC transporter ATP-binding protein [Planctomycetota bacterium]
SIALLDEVSQGLAPFVVDRVKDAVLDFKKEYGTSFLVVEQEIKFATSVADRIYGLLTGSVVYEGTPRDFLDTEAYTKFLVIV